QSSMSWSEVEVAEDGTVSYLLRLSSRDLGEAVGRAGPRAPADAEIDAGKGRLEAYVLARVHVSADGRACPATAGPVGILRQTDRFAEVRFTARCGAPVVTLAIDYDLFFDVDPRHVGMLRVAHAGQTVTAEVTARERRVTFSLRVAAPTGLAPAAFVGHGMMHIYTGYDHIAFLVGMLLVAAAGGRSLGAAARETLKVVTAFTVAHSVTLILAALDVV